MLLESEAAGHLLAQDPFIETTPRYASSSAGYLDLGLPAGVGGLLDRLSHAESAISSPEDRRTVLLPSIYTHQARAFEAFLRDGRDIVVATGTGSGKTECFLVPILGSLYQEAESRPQSFRRPGVRALILYPMNALVNDQLARLRLIFGDPEVTKEFRDSRRGSLSAVRDVHRSDAISGPEECRSRCRAGGAAAAVLPRHRW